MNLRPYFAADGPAARRLLLISYHFPPSETAGALRWQKMAALAGERGWALDVLALDPPQLRQTDWSRLQELPPGTRVFGVRRDLSWFDRLDRALTPAYRWLRSRGSGSRPSGDGARAATAVEPSGIVQREQLRWRLTSPGDYRRALHAWQHFAREGVWSRGARGAARALARSTPYAAVITCGPPHMAHLAGSSVAASLHIPHIMDFRDPWSAATAIQTQMASPLWLSLAGRYERRAVARAALVVANTPALAETMARIYPRARIITVLNGYDDEPMPDVERPNRFVVAYAGSIYIDRSPRLLFRAAARVIRELGLQPSQLGFSFIGHLDDSGGASLLAMAREESIEGFVEVGPPRSRRAALEFMARASMLVSLPQQVPLAVPSKIFEYMRFDAWVLALSPAGTATARLLLGTRADVCDPHDVDGLARVLRTRYEQFARGERPARLPGDERLGRRAQAAILLDALDQYVGAR